MAKPYGRLYQKGKNVSIIGIDTYDVWPIGSIFMSIYATNPSTYFGGTWERISQGRFLIGVKENNNYQENNIPDFGETTGMKGYLFNAEDRGGEYLNKLDIQHYISHVYNTMQNEPKNDLNWMWTPVSGGFGLGSVYTSNKNEPHNNMPPYFGVYMWKRTG